MLLYSLLYLTGYKDMPIEELKRFRQVVVPEGDQAPKLEVARKRDRLPADTLHEAAVAHEDVGEVVDQVVTELGVHDTLTERHPDRLRDALPERPVVSSMPSA